jgi:hypothetical protein
VFLFQTSISTRAKRNNDIISYTFPDPAMWVYLVCPQGYRSSHFYTQNERLTQQQDVSGMQHVYPKCIVFIISVPSTLVRKDLAAFSW